MECLALQESHFNNFRNLAPYFVLFCFHRLELVYIVPLELKNDIDFFCSCTVSSVSTSFSFVSFLTTSLFCYQEFMYCVLPYVIQTLIMMDVLPLSAACLHSLLEEFVWPFYYSKAALALDTFLNSNHSRQFGIL